MPECNSISDNDNYQYDQSELLGMISMSAFLAFLNILLLWFLVLTIFIIPVRIHCGKILPCQQPNSKRDFTGNNLCRIINYNKFPYCDYWTLQASYIFIHHDCVLICFRKCTKKPSDHRRWNIQCIYVVAKICSW